MKKNFLKITLKGTKLQIIYILLFSILNAKLVILVPKFVQYAIDGVVMGKEEVIPFWMKSLFFQNDKVFQLVILTLCLILVNLLIFAIAYRKNKINTKFNLKINRNVKQSILEHIPKLKYEEFTNINQSDVIQRVNNDSITYANFFNSQISLFLDTIFIGGFAITEIFELNLVIGIFITFLCFCIIALSIWFLKKSKPLVEEVVECNKNIIQKTSYSVQEAKMIKAFNREQMEIKNFRQANERYRKKDIQLAKVKVIYHIGTHSIRNFRDPFILLYGGILVVQEALTLAQISVLIALSGKIVGNLYETVVKLKEINEFVVAYQKLSDLMAYPEEREDKPDKTLEGDIRFEKVTIKVGDNLLLEDINLELIQGENVAIIGDNGCGKTIFAKTLLGFYEYTGNIYIGKENIRDISKKSLRKYIDLVLQDTYLFTDTISNNLKIVDEEISEEEMRNACKVADIEQDIKAMPEGIHTVLESSGNNLSGGQKQRLSIARTVLSHNQFIILDDSLSKLDTKTKLRILENMLAIQRGVLIISHDIEVAKACQKVLFIKDRHIQVGNHETFLRENQEYKQMIELKQNTILEDEE